MASTPKGGGGMAGAAGGNTMTGAPGAGPAAGGGGLIRGKDGKLHTRDEVGLYGGSLNGEVAAQSPWAAFSGGGAGGGSYQDPNLPAGVLSPAGKRFKAGGGDQNAFSPEAGTWVDDPTAGGGGNQAAALRAILAQYMGRGAPGKQHATGDRAGYTTSGR